MSKTNHLTTIGFIGILAASASAFADDGDVQHARLLLEEARTFGVSGITGQAAGQFEAEREERRQAASATLTENDKRWNAISESQSYN